MNIVVSKGVSFRVFDVVKFGGSGNGIIAKSRSTEVATTLTVIQSLYRHPLGRFWQVQWIKLMNVKIQLFPFKISKHDRQ